MPTLRRTKGEETRKRLADWTQSHGNAELLAAGVLATEEFVSIDPSHPLGGPDGLKDMVCLKADLRWVAAAYFPHTQRSFTQIKKKFKEDSKGATNNSAQGFCFVTNQSLTLGDREQLTALSPVQHTDIYHLERVALILDQPGNYGLRLEFLDIQMNKEEQLSFFETVAKPIRGFENKLNTILKLLESPDISKRIPSEQLREFKEALESIVGPPTSSFALLSTSDPPMARLKVPLQYLEKFQQVLQGIVGSDDPFVLSTYQAPINRLSVPLEELVEYEKTLDRILLKLKRLPR